MRGFEQAGVLEAIREAGGEVYAVTSEPQTLAKNAEQDWQTGCEHVGDPHQEIADACAKRGWISLFTGDWQGSGPEAKLDWVSHPKGFFQPGILAVSQTGRVLYRWRSRPTRQNAGGAVARPTPDHVWRSLQTELEASADAADAPPDDDPQLDAGSIPWPFFVALLFANGWFLEPVTFHQLPGEDTVPRRLRNAMLRVPLFVAAWIAVAVLLPGWLVALLFAAWVAKIIPGLREVHERFEHVEAGEEPT